MIDRRKFGQGIAAVFVAAALPAISYRDTQEYGVVIYNPYEDMKIVFVEGEPIRLSII